MPAVQEDNISASEPSTSAPFFDFALFGKHYSLQDHVLGTGASGDVLTAVCRKTGKVFAVKSFEKSRMSPKKLANMRSELELHAGVKHNNIVEVVGIYESEKLAHVVMEYLQGGELFFRVIQVKQVQEDKAVEVTRQLLQAANYLHERNIVHRDIKMENLVFAHAESWTVKLIDFGFAARCSNETGLVQKCGTLQYAAPEVLRGIPYAEKADVWSVGCVVFSMLTGQMPYSGKDAEVFDKAKAGSVDYSHNWWQLSPPAQDFVRTLLTVAPGERPSAREALSNPWLRCTPHHTWGAAWLEKALVDATNVKDIVLKAAGALGLWPDVPEVAAKSEF